MATIKKNNPAEQEEQKEDALTPSMKLEIHEIINTKIGKFASNIQRVSVALGLILGFFGYKSCDEIKNSIKAEAKQEIVNTKLDEDIKRDIRRTQLDGILNNLGSKIEKEDIKEDDIKDTYVVLFNSFFQDSEETSISILETLNRFKPDWDYNFGKTEGKSSLINSIRELAQKTTGSELKYQCYKFLIKFSEKKDISILIENFKKDFVQNSSSQNATFTDDLLIQLAQSITDEKPGTSDEKEIYINNVSELNEISNVLINNHREDPYFPVYVYTALLKINDRKEKIVNYSDALAKHLRSNQSLMVSLIETLNNYNLVDPDVAEENNVDDDSTFNFESAIKNVITGQIYFQMKTESISQIRKDIYTKGLSPMIRKNPEFSSYVFNGLCNKLSKSTDEKVKVMTLFGPTRLTRLARSRLSLTTTTFLGKLLKTGFDEELMYDVQANRFYYTDEGNVKQVFDSKLFGEISIQFHQPARPAIESVTAG